MTSPASQLGKLSWKKRAKKFKTKKHMKALSALGVKARLDKAARSTPNS
jgi:hypothetical protein